MGADSLHIENSPVNIQVIATDRPINGVLNVMDYSPGYDTALCKSKGECINELGGNRGHINSCAAKSKEAVVHDILHFAGIKDRYTEPRPDQNGNRRPGRGTIGLDGYQYTDTNIMTSRSGTILRPIQIREGWWNTSTRHCIIQNGVTKCN